MSAARASRERPAPAGRAGAQQGEVPELRERRRLARRRQRVARIDLGLGAVAALVLLLASPGRAIPAVIALLVLLVCALSLVVERRRRRRAEHARRAGARPRADARPGSGPRAAPDGRRQPR
jgi:Flp pilus assembly protein TadB